MILTLCYLALEKYGWGNLSQDDYWRGVTAIWKGEYGKAASTFGALENSL